MVFRTPHFHRFTYNYSCPSGHKTSKISSKNPCRTFRGVPARTPFRETPKNWMEDSLHEWDWKKTEKEIADNKRKKQETSRKPIAAAVGDK